MLIAITSTIKHLLSPIAGQIQTTHFAVCTKFCVADKATGGLYIVR